MDHRKYKHMTKGHKTVKQNEKYKKYIGNRSEGQGFADKRKRKIQYDYMKMMKKEKLREKLRQASAELKSELNVGKTIQSKHSEQNTKSDDMGFSGKHLPKPSEKIIGLAENTSIKSSSRKGRPISNSSNEVMQQTSEQEKFKGKWKGKHQNAIPRKDGKVSLEKTTRFSKVAEQHRKKKEEKALKHQKYLESKHKRDEAIGAYHKRKQETFKKICKKTHKGQPVMKNQIEYLLQKIEKQVNHR